ncbi:unnamed protein product [Rotaria sp. Silwood2]|nr:unnamed protein product [Rotaria sp. Silwood2]CAF3386030.1 unnamed protein product [Rotaria sp. Silwood2]CAF4566084.1 unnamed protein product [Rotaria sp. Silwood2]
MDTYTYFEDLSNEIFFEIFDYLHAFEIFTGFTSINKLDFISFHLTFHDYTSVIDLLFHRHNFTNLETCVLIANSSPTKLENVIKLVKTPNKLVSFRIYESNDHNISTIDKSDLARIMLMHKSSVHSVQLHYRYHYMDISNYTSISSNLILLKLYICGSPFTVSVYSILSTLHLCQTIRYLSIIVA